MKTREEAVALCKKYKNVYEDYPFTDTNWTVMRHKDNKKIFAWVFYKDNYIWINVKCSLDDKEFYRNAYKSVIPAFHLNKEHWSSIILDGTVLDVDIKRMIDISYKLTKAKK